MANNQPNPSLRGVRKKGREATDTNCKERSMTPAAKEGLPAVVGELVAEMRDVVASGEPMKFRYITEWADRLSALTAEAGEGEVTDAMVEAAARVVAGSDEEWDDYSQIVRDGLMEIQREALTTALALSTATPAGEWREGVNAAIAWVEKRRHDFESENGRACPDTGATEFRNGACEEYASELGEIEEGLRAMLAASPRGASAGEG
jgi:hypothetical protein